jgi:hypothetical protein
LLGFPRIVNEKAARVVAAVVAVVALVILATGWWGLLVPVAAGFWLRVAAGPKLSPLGMLAARVVAPRLGRPKEVAGPPKRFAQSIGAVLTTAAAIAALAFGAHTVAGVLVAMLFVAATLESVFALCLGCQAFTALMRAGIVPPEVCAECADISSRLRAAES